MSTLAQVMACCQMAAVVVVILSPEEYIKHMHNIITVISQNIFFWWLPEKLRGSSSRQPHQAITQIPEPMLSTHVWDTVVFTWE